MVRKRIMGEMRSFHAGKRERVMAHGKGGSKEKWKEKQQVKARL